MDQFSKTTRAALVTRSDRYTEPHNARARSHAISRVRIFIVYYFLMSVMKNRRDFSFFFFLKLYYVMCEEQLGIAERKIVNVTNYRFFQQY